METNRSGSTTSPVLRPSPTGPVFWVHLTLTSPPRGVDFLYSFVSAIMVFPIVCGLFFCLLGSDRHRSFGTKASPTVFGLEALQVRLAVPLPSLGFFVCPDPPTTLAPTRQVSVREEPSIRVEKFVDISLVRW